MLGGIVSKFLRKCQESRKLTLMETLESPADFSISTLTSLLETAPTNLFRTFPLEFVFINDLDLNPRDIIFPLYQSVMASGLSLLSRVRLLTDVLI